MKIFISNYYNIRFFSSNMIPIAVTQGWPYWLTKNKPKLYLDSNNVLIGIKEDSLAFPAENFEKLSEQCQKNCPYLNKVPNCQFMTEYYKYLKLNDFNLLLKEFERIANETKKINNYIGEPIIVLMVYEKESCICSERVVLKRWFSDNGYNLEEWDKDIF